MIIPKSEFQQKREITDLKMKYDTERHGFKMKELYYQRESDHLRHEEDMIRQKTKSTAIREIQEMKDLAQMGKRY